MSIYAPSQTLVRCAGLLSSFALRLQRETLFCEACSPVGSPKTLRAQAASAPTCSLENTEDGRQFDWRTCIGSHAAVILQPLRPGMSSMQLLSYEQCTWLVRCDPTAAIDPDIIEIVERLKLSFERATRGLQSVQRLRTPLSLS